jgi:phosphohistidine phosphatase SixA
MLTLLFVRHAKALNRKVAKRRNIIDALRPLTRTGRLKFRNELKRATVLRQIRKLDGPRLGHSGYKRSRETAQLLATEIHDDATQIFRISGVTPYADVQRFDAILRRLFAAHPAWIIVSHEPFLSRFLNFAFSEKWRCEKIRKGAFVVVHVHQAGNRLGKKKSEWKYKKYRFL